MIELSGLTEAKPNSAAHAAAKRAVSHANTTLIKIESGRDDTLVSVSRSSWIAFIILADSHRGHKTPSGSQDTT